jgi:putative DNA primase/helicase
MRLTRAADIRARSVEWLWDGRVPLGMLSMWAGAPKQGKSLVTLDLASAVSRGAPMPMSRAPAKPGSVILMSAEDDPARTIVPRLKAAGADLSRIHLLESILIEDGAEALPTLKHDLATIEAVAERLGDCRLIVIDPISAYLGKVDDHRNAELRGVLSPLKAVAERLDLSAVLLNHLNKGGTGSALDRTMGSVAYAGACRSNSLFVRDRNDASGRTVLMLHSGGNAGPPPAGLAYTIEDCDGIGRIAWRPEPVEITADEALAAERAAFQTHIDAPERREAEEFLKEVLAEGPVLTKKILAAAKEAGFSPKTLRQARERMQVVTSRRGFGPDKVGYWQLR